MHASRFPHDRRVTFTVEMRKDGHYNVSGSNVPLLHVVVSEGNGPRYGMSYKQFLTLAGEHLAMNNAPSGEIKEYTPWDEAVRIGKGFVRFG